MSQIKSEIPSGIINGINNEFNTSNSATYIISVFKDGVEIDNTGYTYLGTLLTFNVAPIYSVSICYVTGLGFALNSNELLKTNELLTGLINGINKDFTSVYPIKQILSVVYDGVETKDYSFELGSNKITFLNAPEISSSGVYMDYITNSDGIDENFGNNASQTDIIDRIYLDILKEKTTSTIFRLETCKSMINEVQEAVLKGGYITISGDVIPSTGLSFLKKSMKFKYYKTGFSNTELNSGQSYIDVSNSWPITGSVYVNGSIYNYNGNDGKKINLVNTLKGGVNIGDTVRFAYGVNNDFDYSTVAKRSRTYGEEKTLDYIDNRENFSDKLGYSIINDYYNNKYIIFLGSISEFENIYIEYIRKIPKITETLNSIIPGEYAIGILSNLVASRMLINSEEPTKAKNIELMGVNELKRLYSNYSKQVKKFRGKIKSSNIYHIM